MTDEEIIRKLDTAMGVLMDIQNYLYEKRKKEQNEKDHKGN